MPNTKAHVQHILQVANTGTLYGYLFSPVIPYTMAIIHRIKKKTF